MKVWILLLVAGITFISCERSVDFKLNEVEPKLVVEATIENGSAPIVYLSSSQAFFSKVDLNALAGSFVRNAEVYISNGVLTHQLKEYSTPIAPGINFYYYSIDPANPATAFLGQVNTTYTLRIVTEGKEYTSRTTIPGINKTIDTLYWKPAPPGVTDTNKVRLMVRLNDPPVLGNYARYFTNRNQEPFYPGFASVFDDQIIDGTTYEVPVDRSVPRFEDQPENWFLFDKGDTVRFKLCNIDKATFDFWRTLEFSYANTGNPFSSPIKVLSNISNGGLGYFGGYGVQIRTLIIPK